MNEGIKGWVEIPGDEVKPKVWHVCKITFPAQIKQVSETTVEMTVKLTDFPLLGDEAIRTFAPDLSRAE